MKTRWGSCNIRARRIWLNLELAKKPFACVEYVLVHELVHLLEPSHNARFKQLMHQFLPQGALLKARLKGDIVTDENRLD
jgi:predicted metal-dependent hydrolase